MTEGVEKFWRTMLVAVIAERTRQEDNVGENVISPFGTVLSQTPLTQAQPQTQAPLYLAEIKGTVAGGVAARLGPKTLIHGPNESGKSTLRRTIELALASMVTDVVGRDEMKKEAELLANLGTGRENLIAEGVLSDGSQVKQVINRLDKKVKGRMTLSGSAETPVRPASVGVDVFPLHDLRESILGSPQTARKFFLSKTAPVISREDTLALLPPSLHDEYVAAVQARSKNAGESETDRILMAFEYASEKATASNTEAKAKETSVNEMGQGLAPPPTDEVLKQARLSLKAAEQALEQAIAAEARAVAQAQNTGQAAAQIAELDAKIAETTAKQLAWQQNVASWEAYLAGLPMPLTQEKLATLEAVLALGTAIDTNQLAIACSCGAVGQLVSGCRTMKAQMSEQLAARQNAEATIATMRTSLTETGNELARLQSAKSAILPQTVQLQTTAPAMMAGQPNVPVPTSAEARQRVETSKATLKQYEDAKASWESAHKMRDAALSAERNSQGYARLRDELAQVVRKVLDMGIEKFSSDVQKYLPPTDRFGLRLHDQGREVCQFGLWKEDVVTHEAYLITALSGVQWARVTAAMAAACSPPQPGKLQVIIPEERAFDPSHLADVMRSFTAMPQQVILESPIFPAEVPEGWTVVSSEEARAAGLALRGYQQPQQQPLTGTGA